MERVIDPDERAVRIGHEHQPEPRDRGGEGFIRPVELPGIHGPRLGVCQPACAHLRSGDRQHAGRDVVRQGGIIWSDELTRREAPIARPRRDAQDAHPRTDVR